MGVDKTDILLVDDKLENLISLEGLLESDRLRFIRALSGEEALEAVLTSSPALILLDVQMPGMDGFEVARLLRSMERTREIPLIFVTATQREERLSFQGFESGAVDYLFKPLNAMVVRSKVRVFVELHRTRLRLEAAVRDLSSLNEELKSFSYSVSHDLRAPLRRMMEFTNWVLNHTEDFGEEHLNKLKRALFSGEKMNRLIDSLLSLSQVTRVELRKQTVNLSALAAQACEDARPSFSSGNIEFEIAENVKGVGDQRLLENVLSNLVSNAAKFTVKADPARVQFGSYRRDGTLVYYVKDNGVGFDMKYADRLFGAFQRLHREDEFPGTGVGLATVQRIVHRHGGRIWAESQPDKGATFYFTLQER